MYRKFHHLINNNLYYFTSSVWMKTERCNMSKFIVDFCSCYMLAIMSQTCSSRVLA